MSSIQLVQCGCYLFFICCVASVVCSIAPVRNSCLEINWVMFVSTKKRNLCVAFFFGLKTQRDQKRRSFPCDACVRQKARKENFACCISRPEQSLLRCIFFFNSVYIVHVPYFQSLLCLLKIKVLFLCFLAPYPTKE